MWLEVPEEAGDILWEGSLELASEEVVRSLERTLEGETKDVRDLPVVSIGRPEVWALDAVYPPEEMPPLLRAKAEEAEFYLVRFYCSFRPIRKKSSIEWARFHVHLLPDRQAQQPTAYDLHPREVTHEAQRNTQVTLGPSLKFQEVEASLGNVSFGLKYLELQPSIIASGIGERSPSWDFEEGRGIRIAGGKCMHALVRAPRGTGTVRAILDLTADVMLRGRWLPVVAIRNQQQAQERLTVRLV